MRWSHRISCSALFTTAKSKKSEKKDRCRVCFHFQSSIFCLILKHSICCCQRFDHVDFYVSNSRVCTDTTAPYSCDWQVPSTKRHYYSLKAIATDTSGNTKTSKVVTVRSSN
ncbi:MAG TPA: Ig-like domain-containing protein [Candidatus Paceibacterota bacterium]|nr:Ig-like domain-containing protein [Candidatus Paceibacterota bacterium]